MKPIEQRNLEKELQHDNRYKAKVINNKKKDLMRKKKWKDNRIKDEVDYYEE